MPSPTDIAADLITKESGEPVTPETMHPDLKSYIEHRALITINYLDISMLIVEWQMKNPGVKPYVEAQNVPA